MTHMTPERWGVLCDPAQENKVDGTRLGDGPLRCVSLRSLPTETTGGGCPPHRRKNPLLRIARQTVRATCHAIRVHRYLLYPAL